MTLSPAHQRHGTPRPDGMTNVQLTWIEKRIEHWIRFGRIAKDEIVDRRRRIVSFRPGGAAGTEAYDAATTIDDFVLGDPTEAYPVLDPLLDPRQLNVGHAVGARGAVSLVCGRECHCRLRAKGELARGSRSFWPGSLVECLVPRSAQA